MYIYQSELLDNNLYKIITDCHIHSLGKGVMQITVTYADGERERIWTYNQNKYMFDESDFIGRTKIEAVFYCDRKLPRRF